MADKSFEKPDSKNLVLICGPPRFVNSAEEIMEKRGHNEEDIYIF